MLLSRPALLGFLAVLASLWTLHQVVAQGEDESTQGKAYQAEKEGVSMMVGYSNLPGTPLHTAARDGNRNEVVRLLDDGIDVNQVVEGVSALWIASAFGREGVVDVLLASKADVDFPGPDGLTPLLTAAENGYDSIILMLLRKGADIEAKNNKGSTALILGTVGVHPRVVRVLLENQADVEAELVTGITSLLIAAYIGDLYIVKTLLSAGADVENADTEGATPLFVAAQGGHELVVHELLQTGANVGTPRMDGSTPLHAAAAGCHLAAVELLLDAEANPVFMDIFGRTAADYIHREKCTDEHVLYAIEAILRPLFYASQEGNAWVVSTLLENGGDVNSVLMSNRRTPLHIASAHSRQDVIRVLIAAGGDISLRDVSGARPIDILGSERPPEPSEVASITMLLVDGTEPEKSPYSDTQDVKSEQDPMPKSGNKLDEGTFSPLSMFVLLGIGIVIGLVFACIGGSVLAHIYRTRCEKMDCPELYARCGQNSASSKQVSSVHRGTHAQSSPYHNPSYMKKIPDPSQHRRVGSDQIVSIGYVDYFGSTRRSNGHLSPPYDRQTGDSRGSHRSSSGIQAPGTSMLENAVDTEPNT